MFSSPENHERQIDRMSGCAGMGTWIWKWVTRLLYLLLAPALIYFIFCLLHPVTGGGGSQKMIEQRMAKHIMKAVHVSMGRFKTEYGKLPIEPNEAQLVRSDGLLLRSIIDSTSPTNPRGIFFLPDLPSAKPGVSGLTWESSNRANVALVDAWGERYYLMLESTDDDRIPNPERLHGASGRPTVSAPEFISSFCLIFSSGPDKDPSTWDDNICSWR